jgi:Conserved TM helix/Mechanosensitive ion channel
MTLQPVVTTLLKIIFAILNFLPLLINGLIILILGYLICVFIRWIVRFILRHIGFDQLIERVGITDAMGKLGVRIPLSTIIAQLIFFFLLLSFFSAAMSLIGFAAVADLLQSVLRFIPKVISAAIIVIFGSMLASFLGNTVTSLASNVNIAYDRALGKIIEYALVAFIIVLAISTLGVDTTILTTVLALIVASAGIAIALTFAFGARESARNVIAGFYVRQHFQPGQQVTYDTYSGTVRSTTGAYTVVEVTGETGEQNTIALPNALLLRRAVLSQGSALDTKPKTDEDETSS